jgi:hypothetical protein
LNNWIIEDSFKSDALADCARTTTFLLNITSIKAEEMLEVNLNYQKP